MGGAGSYHLMDYQDLHDSGFLERFQLHALDQTQQAGLTIMSFQPRASPGEVQVEVGLDARRQVKVARLYLKRAWMHTPEANLRATEIAKGFLSTLVPKLDRDQERGTAVNLLNALWGPDEPGPEYKPPMSTLIQAALATGYAVTLWLSGCRVSGTEVQDSADQPWLLIDVTLL
jgi:hypothetical protein